jgi:uncharacterized membrane protein
MEGLVTLVLLILAGFVALIIWLTVKAVTLSNEASEFRLRQERFEAELQGIKRSLTTVQPAPAAQPAIASSQSQAAAQALESTPPREQPATPPPIPTPVPERKPVFTPPPLTVAPAPVAQKVSPPLIQIEAPRRTAPVINWEQFMGVKLFAWIGGFALFLAVAFFVKYSFENNLISPQVRVALSFLTGIGLVIGGVALKKRDYLVTSQTLCATGTVILYAATFACHSVYKFPLFGTIPTFLLMTLITTTAFLLAVRMEAQVVAVLGLVGGFLTPVLLGSNVDNSLALFGYIALLDLGLMAVGLNRRWYYLVLLGALGTIAMQLGWVDKFFEPAKVFIAMAIFLGFDVLFMVAFGADARRRQFSPWLVAST